MIIKTTKKQKAKLRKVKDLHDLIKEGTVKIKVNKKTFNKLKDKISFPFTDKDGVTHNTWYDYEDYKNLQRFRGRLRDDE